MAVAGNGSCRWMRRVQSTISLSGAAYCRASNGPTTPARASSTRVASARNTAAACGHRRFCPAHWSRRPAGAGRCCRAAPSRAALRAVNGIVAIARVMAASVVPTGLMSTEVWMAGGFHINQTPAPATMTRGNALTTNSAMKRRARKERRDTGLKVAESRRVPCVTRHASCARRSDSRLPAEPRTSPPHGRKTHGGPLYRYVASTQHQP